MLTTTISDWGQAMMTSVAAALALFLAAVPRIVGFLAIWFIGWLLADLVAGAAARLLRAVRFNALAERSGLSGFVHQMGVRTDPSGAIAGVVNWCVRLMALVVAFDALGLPAVSQVLQLLLLWLPNVVVALVVLVIAGLAANALYRLVRGATAQAGLGSPALLGNLARVAVWAFAVAVALSQLGVATTLVNILFTGVVGALALGFGLAFGLGGRETAGEMVRDWYRRSQQAAPRAERVADAAEPRVFANPTDLGRELGVAVESGTDGRRRQAS